MPVKILILSTVYFPYHIGGAEISTQILAEGLSAHYKVSILTHGEKDEYSNINGVNVIRHNYGKSSECVFSIINKKKIPMINRTITRLFDLFFNIRLFFYYKNLFNSFDIIIASGNCTRMGQKTIWYTANKINVPLIQIIRDPALLYFKNNKPSKHKIFDKLYRLFTFKISDYVTFFVAPTKRILLKHIDSGMKIKEFSVIPNTVSNNLCSPIMFKDKINVILYVGIISKNKGCDTLIKAFQRLNNDFRLIMIGEIVDVEIPINVNIEYKGHLDLKTVYEFMAKSKLLVLPSEWDEAFGRVLVEAVFNHTIAIGSSAGGIPELFGKNKQFIFESGNIDELYEKMLLFTNLNENEYIKNLDILLKEFKKFRSENHIKMWEEYIFKILNEGKNLCKE